MTRERRLHTRPFLSVCIPQYNRTSFLLDVCRSLERQDYRDFEVCISDDCSTDGRERELLAWLEQSRLAFAYVRQPQNLRYDGNLRAAMSLATAPWTFLLGNDDVIKGPGTLAAIATVLRGTTAQVAFTNFEDYRTGEVTRRAPRTGIVGAGPRVAAASFRKFSFVSGIVLDTAAAHAQATPAWDGSEMYQMFIGSRLIAAGGAVLDIDEVTVRKDLQLAGETVDSYASHGRAAIRGIPIQAIPFARTARLVLAAIEPHLPRRSRRRIVASVLNQYFGFLYPYWLLEYRRVGSWRYAAGVARAVRPARSLRGARLSAIDRLHAAVLFGAATTAGLGLPVGLMRRLQRPARRLARVVGGLGVTPSRT